MTPEQRRRNRIVGLVLFGLVLAVLARTIFHGAAIFISVAVN